VLCRPHKVQRHISRPEPCSEQDKQGHSVQLLLASVPPRPCQDQLSGKYTATTNPIEMKCSDSQETALSACILQDRTANDMPSADPHQPDVFCDRSYGCQVQNSNLSASELCICTLQTPYKELQQNCNLWRNWIDIQASWQSLSTIVKFWALASQRSKGFTDIAGPGSWNDPDMLIIGSEV